MGSGTELHSIMESAAQDLWGTPETAQLRLLVGDERARHLVRLAVATRLSEAFTDAIDRFLASGEAPA